MNDGFIKVGAASPVLRVSDPAFNCDRIIEMMRSGAEKGVKVLAFPELSITGYTAQDLFFQKSLRKSATEGLERIVKASSALDVLIFVGYPFEYKGKLYNTAAAIKGGHILALIAKKNLPSYGEFYETRWFTPSPEENVRVEILGDVVPFGRKIILSCTAMPTLSVGAEICEDLWVSDPPCIHLAENGATIIVNLSASDEVIGKAEYRKSLVQSTSARLASGYVYADASYGESTTDMVFIGSNLIAENGSLLASGTSFLGGDMVISEIDTEKLVSERIRMNTYASKDEGYEMVPFSLSLEKTALTRIFPRHPFVPDNDKERAERCRLILSLQALGLARRLEASHAAKAVIGLSGGLDSTLALLVAVNAFIILKRDLKDIIAVTMPCFGTTERTKSNAERLAESLGVSFRTVDITKSVLQHFEDIGQDKDDLSVTYENSQARERTQVLMDIANKTGGIVIGTGDLSELALGWATYNGDHMSMYGVNSSIPKTLVRYLVRYTADTSKKEEADVLYDILDTPVSPELLPAKDGKISQVTEDIVGPYELHDFFLYYMIRFGFAPGKIYRLARIAFKDEYSGETIKKWLVIFIRRFFAQQFKRSCLPDGPKVGTVTFSPRSDWRMPSDASAAAWIEEAESIVAE